MRDELNRLEQELKSRYVYSWFGIGVAGLVAAKFMVDRSNALEKELQAQWVWNPATQQEELPEGVDESAISLWYWSGTTAKLLGWISLGWGIKQFCGSWLIKMRIKAIYQTIREQEARQRAQRSFDEFFRQFFGGGQNPFGDNAHYPAPPEEPLPDHYATLGIAPTATPAEIRRAFIALARSHHPDQNADNPNDSGAAERMGIINNAHAVLRDPIQRRDYDQQRRCRAL